MTDAPSPTELLFNRTGLDETRTQSIVEDALAGADDGELFMEYSQSESLAFDDGRLKTASFDTQQGFGLRAVAGESTGYAHASDLSEAAIRRAADTVKAVRAGHGGTLASGPSGTNRHLYVEDNPLGGMDFEAKVKLLQEIDSYARQKDPRVRQVTASLLGSLAGRASDAPRRPAGQRRPPLGAAQRIGRGGRGRSHGER